MNLHITSLSELPLVVEAIRSHIDRGYRIFLFSGELGSGKTTLIKALCHHLGSPDLVSSPTFSLVNAYPTPAGETIYHMDLYRLEKTTDLEQIGFAEYLDSAQLCLIEWPELAMDYFYPPYVRVTIDVNTNNIRNFKITTYDAMDA